MSVTAQATPNFRNIMRDGREIVQQQFRITLEVGTAKERAAYVWLDTCHEMFGAIETHAEAKARQEVEAMSGNVIVRFT